MVSVEVFEFTEVGLSLRRGMALESAPDLERARRELP